MKLIKTFLMTCMFFLLTAQMTFASDVDRMQGFTPPQATTVTGTDTYNNLVPELVIDKDLSTGWTSDKKSASLDMTFPEPIYLKFVQIAAVSTPASNVTYTIYGLQNDEWKVISNPIAHDVKESTILEPIVITEGSYKAIRISAVSPTSWIGIYEITIGDKLESETPVVEEPNPDPSDNRAILVVTMTTGLEKEFDLSMQEVNSFIDWYEAKQAGSGRASYAIDKHDNNKGPFKSRKDYILFDRVLTFEVSEY
ncbi:hypothetical protein [Paenibacillus amylolyticus]|uniref:hypothetical protein n=1 Tax=Paenibacillus amylolyticus TaxID=1451 RepID=UPI000B811D8F|nr:hypothetical protein [Paenibacillus amylolyticus]